MEDAGYRYAYIKKGSEDISDSLRENIAKTAQRMHGIGELYYTPLFWEKGEASGSIFIRDYERVELGEGHYSYRCQARVKVRGVEEIIRLEFIAIFPLNFQQRLDPLHARAIPC